MDDDMLALVHEEWKAMSFATLKDAHDKVQAAGLKPDVVAKAMIFQGLVMLAAAKDIAAIKEELAELG